MAFLTGKALTRIISGFITNAQLALMPANTVKANATAGNASPTDVALAASTLLARGSTGNVAAVTVDGTLAFTGAVLGATGTFTDTAFKLQDNGDPTKSLQFDAALITTGTTRTVQAPDTSGIMMVTATGKADTADIENLAVGTGKIADNAVLNGKLAQMATLTIKGNNTGVLADPKDLTATQTKNLLAITNTDVSGLGTLATQNGTFSGTSSGTNTGDQTSIVGITGTKAQFNAAVTDGDILYVGDITQYTDEQAQDAIGLMIDTSLVYVDATPLLQRAALTGDVTAAAGANATTLATVNANVGSFGLAASVSQFTVNAKGLITAAANVAISVLSTAISDSTAAGRAMLTAATAAAQTALLDIFTAGAKGLVPASGGGTTNFMRADGTWAAPGGGTSLSGTGTVILSTSAYEFEGDIAAVGVVPANKALVWLQTGTDQDENTADMLDLVTLAGIAGTNVITVKMQFSAPSSGPIKLNWSVF